MNRQITVNLGNLVLSLSDAMDLASPALIQHQQRVAFITRKMGKLAKFSGERLEKVFTAALLHDIGALSLEEKISLHDFEVLDPEGHCIRGAILLNSIPLFSKLAKIVRYHHTKWENWEDTIENPLVMDSQLVFLADYLERKIARGDFILHQHDKIISEIKSLSGSYFHSQVVELFLEASIMEEFWLDLVSPRLHSHLLSTGFFMNVEIKIKDLLLLSELFRNIIDFRSRFTSTHSSGVAATASNLARLFGFTESEIVLMEVAGNLHDLGKLAISNKILEKPGKLTGEEMAVMRSHTYYTYSIIDTIGSLNQIAQWAAYHHERLDGSGYPFHCSEGELSTGARIMMAADIFTALAEDRPYRKGMSKKSIMKIMQQLADHGMVDTGIVKLLLENCQEVSSYRAEKQAVAKEFYETQFSYNA